MNLNQFDQVKLFPLPLLLHPSLQRACPFIRPATTAKQEDRDLWRSPFDGIKIMFRPFLRPSFFLPVARPAFTYARISFIAVIARSPSRGALISDYFEPPPGSGINSWKSWLICKRRQRRRWRLPETRAITDGLIEPAIKINGYFHQGRLTVTGSSSYSLSSFSFLLRKERWRIS